MASNAWKHRLSYKDMSVLAYVFGFDNIDEFAEFADWQQLKADVATAPGAKRTLAHAVR